MQNGEKGIPVGRTIAVIAEPDDDLSSLTLPEPVSGGPAAAAPAAAAETPEPKKEEPKKEPKEAAPPKAEKAAAPSESSKADPKQVLFPSVLNLAHQNSLTAEQVLVNVPASGPKHRVTKGDILAYLGKVPQSSVDSVTAEINKLEHLDLSNIKIKKNEPASSTTPAAAEKASEKSVDAKPAKQAPPPPVVLKGLFTLGELETLRFSLEETVGTTPSIKQLVEKASKLALSDVPAFTKAKKSILNDPVFDSLVAPSNKGLKPFEVNITYPTVPKKAVSAKRDIYDILGSTKKSSARVTVSDALDVSVVVNGKYIGAEKKAQVYLDRLNYYLSAGRGDLLL